MTDLRVLLIDTGLVMADVLKRTAFARRAFAESGAKAVLFTQDGILKAFPEISGWFDQVLEFKDLRSNCEVELTALKLHKQAPFSHILAYREFEILRAARMRMAWGLGGQDEHSAMVFRDKLLMKEAAEAAGIPVLPFRAVGSVWDLFDSARRFGFPFAIKPRREGGMMGLTGISGQADMESKARRLFSQNSDYPLFYLAEPFCKDRMAHVDGIWKDGRFLCVCASVYSGPGPLEGRMPCDSDPAGSFILPGSSPLSKALCSFTEKVLAALPSPAVTSFHSEIWIKDNGELFLNEIASRPGGMYITDMLSEVFGVPLETALTKELLGVPSGIPLNPEKLSQNFRVPVLPGRVLKMPRGCPLPWVKFFYPECGVGDVLKPPRVWYESMASFVTMAASAEELESQRAEAMKWFRSEVEIAVE